MAEKKIVKQYNGFMYYEDGSKISIKEYREKLNKAPLKSTVKKTLNDKKEADDSQK